jgi:hypothetical protein
MTCKHCKYEYCWLCAGEWWKHDSTAGGYYICNVYENVKAEGGTTTQEKVMADAQAKIQKVRPHDTTDRCLSSTCLSLMTSTLSDLFELDVKTKITLN